MKRDLYAEVSTRIVAELAQLAQLGAGFGYFPGFCIA
jgi:hypothetical protein